MASTLASGCQSVWQTTCSLSRCQHKQKIALLSADVRLMNMVLTSQKAYYKLAGSSSTRLWRSFLSTSFHISAQHEDSVPARHRGGSNLAWRVSRFPRLSFTEDSFVNTNTSSLSAPGLAYPGSQNAASRLAREGEEYTLVGGVPTPKKPRPPAEDGSFLTQISNLALFIQILLV